MLTVEECKTPEEAWALLLRVIGETLSPVAVALKANQADLPKVADKAKRKLVVRLGTLAHGMGKNGYSEDFKKFWSIRSLVLKGDLTDPRTTEKIHEVVNDMVEHARTDRKG